MFTKNVKFTIIALIFLAFSLKSGITQNDLTGHIIIIQPIVINNDNGEPPASTFIPENLIDRAYKNADIDIYFLEPIYFNNSSARDGLISLDSICLLVEEKGFIKGTGDIVNMFFVDAVDGKKGPLGRGMFGGNISFIGTYLKDSMFYKV